MSFELVQGVSADNLEGIHSAYQSDENGISAILSGELISPVVAGVVEHMKEPVFFFMEIPCSEDEEKKLRKSKSDPFHYNVYYLDGCTISVAKAIMKRYGSLLVNDGLCSFGFGSHENGEEIYCMKYQELRVFGKAKTYEDVFKSLNIPKRENYKSMWDNFSDETPGSCSAVEINGESVYDIIENLKAEGMYLAETRAEE